MEVRVCTSTAHQPALQRRPQIGALPVGRLPAALQQAVALGEMVLRRLGQRSVQRAQQARGCQGSLLCVLHWTWVALPQAVGPAVVPQPGGDRQCKQQRACGRRQQQLADRAPCCAGALLPLVCSCCCCGRCKSHAGRAALVWWRLWQWCPGCRRQQLPAGWLLPRPTRRRLRLRAAASP